MAPLFAKTKTKVPSPRAKPSGVGKFAHAANPKVKPLKTRIYTKDVIRQDPASFSDFGFGDTGLAETPSIIGMGRSK